MHIVISMHDIFLLHQKRSYLISCLFFVDFFVSLKEGFQKCYWLNLPEKNYKICLGPIYIPLLLDKHAFLGAVLTKGIRVKLSQKSDQV